MKSTGGYADEKNFALTPIRGDLIRQFHFNKYNRSRGKMFVSGMPIWRIILTASNFYT